MKAQDDNDNTAGMTRARTENKDAVSLLEVLLLLLQDLVFLEDFLADVLPVLRHNSHMCSRPISTKLIKQLDASARDLSLDGSNRQL